MLEPRYIGAKHLREGRKIGFHPPRPFGKLRAGSEILRLPAARGFGRRVVLITSGLLQNDNLWTTARVEGVVI